MIYNFKKIICILLCLLMLVGNIVYATPYDVEDDSLINKLRLLSALGIMYVDDGSNFRPEDNVTRSDFARYICSLNNLPLSVSNDIYFSDVDVGDSDFDAISTVVMNSIMVGNGDGTFFPNQNVKFIDAVKTVVCVMGYEDIAIIKGGYPIGYMDVAVSQKLLSGIKKNREYITRGQLAILFYNALNTEILKNSRVGERISSETHKGHTLLSEVFNCFNKRGVVTANENTSLFGRGISKSLVKIDDEIYNVGNTDIKNSIGQIVDFYYLLDEDTDTKTIITYQPDDKHFVKIDAADICRHSTNRQILTVYTSVNNTSSYELDENFDLIYNGCYTDFSDISLICPDIGNVLLSDINNDGIYDVINVTSYIVSIVDYICDYGNKVILKNNQQVINFSENFDDFEILSKGKKIEGSELKEWDVLNIAQSFSDYKSICTIIVTDEKIAGTIDGYSFSENGYIQVDGILYEISNYYTDNYGQILSVGKPAIFVLDVCGRIVAINNSLDTRNVAFLYKVSIDNQMDETVGFMMFLPDNSWKTYYSDNRITFNDQVLTPAEVYQNLLCKGDANGVKINEEGYLVNLFGGYIKYSDENDKSKGFVSGQELGKTPFTSITDRQIITYELTNDNKICSIETVDGSNKNNALIMLDSYTGVNASGRKLQWRECMDGFFIEDWYSTKYVSFYADEETTMFLIPFDVPDNKDAYAIRKGLRGCQDLGYCGEVYTFRDNSSLDTVPYLMSSAVSSDSDDLEIVVVDKIKKCIDEDGQDYYVLKCFYQNKMMEYIAKDVSTIQVDGKIISCGDILKMNINSDGSIKKVRTDYKNGIIFNASNNFDSQIGVDGYYRDVTQSFVGYVSDINYGKKRIAINIGEKDEHGNDPSVGMWRYWAQTPVIIVNKKNKTISLGSINDINLNDFVVAVLRYTCTQAIVVYKD